MKKSLVPVCLLIVCASYGSLSPSRCSAFPAAAEGHDFIKEALFIYRVAVCGGGPLPDGVDPAVVDGHCRVLNAAKERYRRGYLAAAMPFIASLRPAGLPAVVFYPFGGGDLLSALLTYPDATEIITVSLESAGDPRKLHRASPARLKTALAECRAALENLFAMYDNSNTNVRSLEKSDATSQLAFALAAAVLFDYEPVSLRFFRTVKDGGLHYLSEDEIATMEHTRGKRLYRWWVDTAFSEAFRNMELVLKKRNENRMLVYYHFAANLDNAHFSGSGLMRFLEKKGKVSAMTKAASYLLWRDDFSALRDYMLSHMVFMVSDSTGILPRHAEAAGFEQITYGRWSGAFLDDRGGEKADSLRRFWNSRPYRPLSFRYGYSDDKGSFHLMITRPRR